MREQGAVLAAVVTASVAVLVAVITQVSTWVMEHRNRVYERRRSALLDVQEAALRVRDRLRELGPTLTVSGPSTDLAERVEVREDPHAAAERSHADALLQMHLARVESEEVRAAVRDWWQAARFSFLGGDDDVTTADEEQAWAAMNEAVAFALTVPGWWRSLARSARRQQPAER